VARREARAQLGTLGSGNHFVELQADEAGALWLMLHSGSRGLGPAIRAFHEARAAPARGQLAALAADGEAGRAYLDDHGYALAWAAASREVLALEVAEVLADVLGAAPVPGTRITCHHNHVRREGERLVHRKGAMPAGDGEPGVIPGSMGSPSYHVVGRGCAAALASASHGAGRAMSRGEARHAIGVATLRRELAGVWFDRRRADDLRDEAPSAYKAIGEVMRAQRELVRVVRRLVPRLAYKA
jgi:tRNA-splicing ligase RtcB